VGYVQKKEEYLEYLKSETWRKKRQQVIELYQTCVLCNGVGQPFHVHHRKYTNLGKEDIHKDLTLLCNKCHKNYHRFVKRKKEKPKKGKRQSLPPVGPSLRQKLWWKEQEQKYREIHPRPKRGFRAEERSQEDLQKRVTEIREHQGGA